MNVSALAQESVAENNTVVNIGRLLGAAKASSMTVAISPHYDYPTLQPILLNPVRSSPGLRINRYKNCPLRTKNSKNLWQD